MKTNKIYKVITIIIILVISMFTFGCGETQEEKFNKLEKQYTEIFKTKGDEIIKTSKSDLSNREIWEKCEQIVNNIKKETNPIIKEMEKVSKGNEKLEKRALIIKRKYNYWIENSNKLLNEMYQGINNR